MTTPADRIAELEAEVASLKRDIQYVDHDFALTKTAHVAAVDELVELRRELHNRDRQLSLAQGSLAHLEHGIKEYRRVEQNLITEVLIERTRREAV